MKRFSPDAAGMTNMRGVFYPTGHMVLMFPTEADARHAVDLLRHDGLKEDDLCLAAPADLERLIAGTRDEGEEDVLLPSIGTESETAHCFRQLAHDGHHALLIHAAVRLSSEHVLDVLKGTPISYGQRYRFLWIEDMVEQPKDT